jgi:hypothetical protein
MAIRIYFGSNPETDTGEDFYSVTYKERVLYRGEHNYYDDSDFYAIVWDDKQGKPVEVTYATTRGWTYNNSATVDATPYIVALWDAYKATQRAEYEATLAAKEAATPSEGKTVRVVHGRKVPIGTVGEVFWYGVRSYHGNEVTRVGLKCADGSKVFTSAGNVEVVT